ncbi:MAG: aldehyde dehydrogenase EutE [Candidatus Eisenbacteria sp.]|nr:aldehyde dehydrogenase EutE [Candidatus Eisenbacteria bacterium]
MSRLTDQQVHTIAERLAARLGVAPAGGSGAGAAGPHDAPLQPGAPATATATAGALAAGQVAAGEAATYLSAQSTSGDGIFASIDAAVEAATTAFRRLRAASLESRTQIIAAIREAMLREAEPLARLAHEETGYGRVDDKTRKNRMVTQKTPGPEDLTPTAMTGDRGLALVEPAPYGVIGAITPVTNASSTLINNAIAMLSAGNSVVFNCHPNAQRVGHRTVQLINRAIVSAGGPANLLATVAEPTIETAQALMSHAGVRLLVVTGGAGVVAAAMRSGKRAICAGPGNPPVVVDETADLEQAGRDIVLGASFDNNIICIDEKEVFVVESVAADLMAAMQRHGAYRLDEAQRGRVTQLIFERTAGPREPGVINKQWIGKDATAILHASGINVAPETRLAIAEVPAEDPLVWTEQMLPVLPIVRVPSAAQAIDLAVAAERGFGHTASMHSRSLDNLSRMASEINCSIFVKNGPCYAGLGSGGEGFCSFTIASPTGEGLTGPRSFSRLRRCVLVDHFRIV